MFFGVGERERVGDITVTIGSDGHHPLPSPTPKYPFDGHGDRNGQKKAVNRPHKPANNITETLADTRRKKLEISYFMFNKK